MKQDTKNTLLRGRVLYFLRMPQGPDDQSSYVYIEDGAIFVQEGRIIATDHYDVLKERDKSAVEIDHRPFLLMPGFIDTHAHFPQVQVIASWGAKLLDWLNNYTFPEEGRFSDPDHCAIMAQHFCDLLLSHGTTNVVSYCSVHRSSAEALFHECHARNMRVIAGKVMMDRNAPQNVCDTPQTGYDDSKDLIEKWHGTGRFHYAITPRFAITSSPEQLEMTSALVKEHPDCYVQTHLSENHDEIALTRELYPNAPDYLGIYEQYGLLTPKTLLGHCIHLMPREIEVLAATQAKPVFCPTSNLFLGSGLFDHEGLMDRGIKNAIATDVGGGTNYSMLQTLNEGYKVLQLQNQNLHPLAAFDWITRGNAAVLGLSDKIGTLAPDTEADIVVLDAYATPAMALRMERAETLVEELFILQMLGDDRSIKEVYVAGQPMKP